MLCSYQLKELAFYKERCTTPVMKVSLLVIFAACILVVSGQQQLYATGFNAYRSSTVSYDAQAVVIFDQVGTNVHTDDSGVRSEPYNPNSGYFTCPVNGIYYFHYTMKSDSLTIFAGEIRLIDTDGVAVEGRFSATRTQEGLDNVSSGCLFRCAAGQTARVVTTAASTVFGESGEIHSNFGGMLVYGIFS